MSIFPAIDPEMFTKDRFVDQVLLITGAGSGMGRCTAIRAAREGGSVAVCDIDEAAATETAKLIRDVGGKAISFRTDVTSATDAENMVKKTVDTFGRLDVAINSAGVMDGGDNGRPAPIHLANEQYLRRTVEVNLFGLMYCCAAEIRQFLSQKQGGSIVNIGSITALTSSPGTPAYVASKHGVSGITRSIAVDYAPYGIRCNSVNMAATETAMYNRALDFVKASMQTQDQGAMVRDGIKSQGLMGRNPTPWEQAATILFIASREASNMTGALIASDGGWTAF